MIMTLVTATMVGMLCWDVHPEIFAYMLLVSIAGAWGVMAPAKFWEGADGDAMVRRFVMMSMGIVLGALAWGCMELLTVDVGQLAKFPDLGFADKWGLPYAVGHDKSPLLATVVVFGTLMLLARWWRQADPLRQARMSLWSMGASMAAAILVASLWQSHGWALVTIAGIMSVSIQIASPWVNPRLRHAGPEE
jgi:hypothetical protein